jgi:hypothetical protein
MQPLGLVFLWGRCLTRRRQERKPRRAAEFDCAAEVFDVWFSSEETRRSVESSFTVPDRKTSSSVPSIAMYPTIPADAFQGAFQLVCYFFAVLVFLIGFVVTARG